MTTDALWLVESESYGFRWQATGTTVEEAKKRLVIETEKLARSQNYFGRPYDGHGVDAYEDYFGFTGIVDLTEGVVFCDGSVLR